MALKSIGQVAYQRPLRLLGMEELAARQKTIIPSGGIMFARNADGEEKQAARAAVLDLFRPSIWPEPLHILTMPGVHWRFERQLLGIREPGWLRSRQKRRRTFFTSVENDRSLYFAAATTMPGIGTPGALIRQGNAKTSNRAAETHVKTRYVSFLFANVDDVVMQRHWHPFDAAWLDFTGPLSIARMAAIADFYEKRVTKTLIVTALNARWDKRTSTAITKAGGHTEWVASHLPGDALHNIDYFDTSPMTQFAVQKTTAAR